MTEEYSVLVYGAGAVGCYLGGMLAHAGHRVTLIGREETASEISQHGLTVVSGDRSLTSWPVALASVDDLLTDGPDFDLILVATKAFDAVAATAELHGLLGNNTRIITLQNGIGTEEAFAQFGHQLVAGSVTTPLMRISPSQVAVEKEGRGLALAAVDNSLPIHDLADLFNDSGVETQLMSGHLDMKWSKLLLNIAGNATSAIVDMHPAALYQDRIMAGIEIAMLREAVQVIRAAGYRLQNLPGAPAATFARAITLLPAVLLRPLLRRVVGSGRGEKMPSFHIALQNRATRSEVSFHNGAVAAEGDRVGVDAAVNRVLTEVLAGLHDGSIDREQFRRKPQRLADRIADERAGERVDSE